MAHRRTAGCHRAVVLGDRCVLLLAYRRADVLCRTAGECAHGHDPGRHGHDRADRRSGRHDRARCVPPAGRGPRDEGRLTGRQMTNSALGVKFADAELEDSVRAGLEAVEAALLDATQSDDEFVADAAGYLAEAGGKRFRPLLCVLASHFGDASRPEVVPAAVVVELTHLATLYHDDVMDEARVRRGEQSAN